jgi:hypothetical protein
MDYFDEALMPTSNGAVVKIDELPHRLRNSATVKINRS